MRWTSPAGHQRLRKRPAARADFQPALLASTLGVSVEALIGALSKRGAGKRGPAPKLQQQLERVHALPKAKQKFVTQMLDTVLQQQGADDEPRDGCGLRACQ